MEVLPWVFSSGWASGINGYAVVVLLGLLGRFGGADGVPPALERTDVLLAAAVLMLVDAVADKIAFLDSFWDVLHTAIRPTIGAVVAALLAGQADTLSQATAATVGGGTALVSHLIKAGIRAGVNTSPEPASNVVVSTFEDLAVAGVVVLSVLSPWLAAAIALFMLLTGGLLVLLLVNRIRTYLRRRRERRALRAPGPPTPWPRT